MTHLRFLAPLALVAVLLPGPASAQAITTAEMAKIDAAVEKSLSDYGVPSASIAVVRGGRLVLAKAYGKASERLPVATAAMPYQVASNSKQFTAMAMLLLEDEGKLSLDDHVSKYVRGITRGEAITLRQLLDHTSGLQDYWPQDYSFAAMARPVSPQGIADIWAHKPLDFQPGDQWQYSNTGYVVAGMVIEKVTGKPLMQVLKERIFAPLGMSSVISQDDAIGARYPQGYGRFALGPVRPVVPAARGWLYSAGELSMTAADMAKWNIARIERSTFPADDWAAQETPTKLNDGKNSNYGLGVFVRSGPRPAITHGGESVGFLSANNVYPADKAAISVFTNSWSGGAYGDIARKLAEIVLPPAPKAPADAAALAAARTVYDQLRAGRLDRTLLTDNANYYFTPQAQADYRSSLAPLGEPLSFEAAGGSTLRGGFVIQGYTAKYANRSLDISTFRDPATGKIEQFLVTPQ